jgi:uncharacterized membrane protein YozB (DUF420 family)
MTGIIFGVAAILLPVLGLVVFLSRNLETHQRLFVFILTAALSVPAGFALYLWLVLLLFNHNPQ